MNDIERRTLIGAAGIGAIAALAKAGGGPLNPPAGAVAPTGRTTDEIYNKIPSVGGFDGRTPIPGGSSAVTLSAPGSYVLTGNIASATNALVISGDGITVDLNGFTVTCTGTASNVISIIGVRTRIVVRNGTVVGGLKGVAINAATTNCLLEDLTVVSPKNTGIGFNVLNASTNTVRRCTVIDVGSTSTATDGNLTLIGISLAGAQNRVEDCSVNGMVYNGVGTPTFLAIDFSSGAATSFANQVSRCIVSAILPVNGSGIRFTGAGIYRDNAVFNFTSAYTGGTNGGGNF